MRFAITMFSLLGVASIIGTVLKQNEPYNNYIIKFGQFWFNIFETLGLYNVYQALLSRDVVLAETNVEHVKKIHNNIFQVVSDDVAGSYSTYQENSKLHL